MTDARKLPLPRLGKRVSYMYYFFYRLLVNMLFLFGGVSSSSRCLAFIDCGIPCAFHIIIFSSVRTDSSEKFGHFPILIGDPYSLMKRLVLV